MVNRSVLCNCGIEVENNFLLESLAACHDADTNFSMYFTVNTAFVNYIDQFTLTETLMFPILTNKTTSEYILPIFLNNPRFDETLSSAPQHARNIFHNIREERNF